MCSCGKAGMSTDSLDRIEAMKYTLAAFFNAMTLVVGVLLGVALAPKIEKNAIAQQPTQISSQTAPTPACTPSATVECVSPIMTVGSAGIGTLLANRIAADQLAVNGYDVLKLENNILNVMISKNLLTPDQAHKMAEDSRPDKLLRFQAPNPPPLPPKK